MAVHNIQITFTLTSDVVALAEKALNLWQQEIEHKTVPYFACKEKNDGKEQSKA